MRNYIKLSLTALVAILFFNAFAVTETKAQSQINELLKRMEAYRLSLNTLQSNIILVKHDSQINKDETMQGILKYAATKNKKDVALRIDWTKPEETLVVNKGTYISYRPKLNVYYTGKADEKKLQGSGGGALDFLNMSREKLKANYNATWIGEETLSGGARTIHLKLMPKTEQKYKFADLWVDADGVIQQFQVTMDNGDSTAIQFSNMQKNSNFDLKSFAFPLPKGAKKIEG